MGGKSESKLEVSEEGIASWKGTLRVEGGGFCGIRSKVTLVLIELLANVSTDKKNMVFDDGLFCELQAQARVWLVPPAALPKAEQQLGRTCTLRMLW